MATAKLELMPNRQGLICILAIPGMIERHLRVNYRVFAMPVQITGLRDFPPMPSGK